MSQSTGAYIEEVEENVENGQNDEGDSPGEDQEQPQASSSSAPAPGGGKKKKKKKSKVSKLLQPGGEIPQQLVNHVVNEVQAKHGAGTEGTDEASVRALLEQLKIIDVLKGKSGLGGKNRKDMGEHKFWQTQPVPQLGEQPPDEDGCIEPSKPANEVRQNPYPLPRDFEWAVVDVMSPTELKELYELLSGNYVEDEDASFRFHYSAEFLRWALQPPGWFPEWNVGVRVASNRKLVAFISAIPMTLRIRKSIVKVSEVNFLCVHKKLRSKRLAPVLIKEITRRCHLKGTFQAIYTAGVILPTPISTCRYFHRSLNVPKLVDVRFTSVPRNSTMARMIRIFSLPSQTSIHGLREMEEKDVPAVHALWHKFMASFDMVPNVTEEDVQHYLLSGRGEGEKKNLRREGQVVWSYVVEDPETHGITDYFSFYTLPSSVINNAKHRILDAVYLFYYGTEAALQPNAQSSGALKKRLLALIGDALIIATQAKFDVFNALTLMFNNEFLQDLKFGSGDGLLNYYLYNWRTAPISGVESIGETPKGQGVGVVML